MDKYFENSMYEMVDRVILEFSDYEYEFVLRLADSEPFKDLWENGPVNFSRFVRRVDDDRVAATFILSKRAWFLFAQRIEKRGLVFSSDDSVREASEQELY